MLAVVAAAVKGRRHCIVVAMAVVAGLVVRSAHMTAVALVVEEHRQRTVSAEAVDWMVQWLNKDLLASIWTSCMPSEVDDPKEIHTLSCQARQD